MYIAKPPSEWSLAIYTQEQESVFGGVPVNVVYRGCPEGRLEGREPKAPFS